MVCARESEVRALEEGEALVIERVAALSEQLMGSDENLQKTIWDFSPANSAPGETPEQLPPLEPEPAAAGYRPEDPPSPSHRTVESAGRSSHDEAQRAHITRIYRQAAQASSSDAECSHTGAKGVSRASVLNQLESAGAPMDALHIAQACGGTRAKDANPVSRPFPSWNRSILTEIYLCHARSYQEILRTETAGQVLYRLAEEGLVDQTKVAGSARPLWRLAGQQRRGTD
eukprot:COSAG01_NODE_3264_length_6333_cov_2.641219_2_plen_230_part_00